MKKKILAAFLSAAVIPGLGQAINGSIKKAGVILTLVMLTVSGGIVSLYSSLRQAAKATGRPEELFSNLGDALNAADLTIPAAFLLAFALIWLFSVVDAFVEGNRQEAQDEILSDR